MKYLQISKFNVKKLNHCHGEYLLIGYCALTTTTKKKDSARKQKFSWTQ